MLITPHRHFVHLPKMVSAASLLLALLFTSLPTHELRAEDQKQGIEAELLTNTRQLTFAGKRAGEGYFNADGSLMVFQSERDAKNPFYQIYLMDRETGDLERISPGYGKTTCAWIHPNDTKVLFASTHGDPASEKLQKEEGDPALPTTPESL